MVRAARQAPAVAVAIALALAGCTPSTTGTGRFGGTPAPSGSRSSSSAAPPPGNPAVDRLAFSDCTSVIAPQLTGQPGADRNLSFGCGRQPVPLDYSAPAGTTIDVFVLRVRYRGQQQRIGSLVVNPGGPGGSGVDAAVGLALTLPLDVLRRFDIVGFDPRGVGLSSPVECISAAEKDRVAALDPDATTPGQYRAQVALSRQIAEGCFAKYGDRLAAYDTENTARDMDVIRQAVGDSRLSYLGYSYGTRLGSVYAHLFPTRVRAMVLDGAVDPLQDEVAAAAGQAGGFENAFNQFAAGCRRRGPACRLGRDPRRLVTALLAAARRSPIPSSRPGETRKATAGHILLAVVSALYDQKNWTELEAALAAAQSAHDASGIFTLADRYSERDSHGNYTNLLDANLAINCADSAEHVSDATIVAKLSRWRVQYPLFGSSMALGLLGCQQWQATRRPVPSARAPNSAPILVVGTTDDPATPYLSAQVLVGQLGHGVLLTWNGEGHTAYPKTRCVTTSVDTYLIDLRPPRPGTTCPRG